jgi:putative oxidoreductase
MNIAKKVGAWGDRHHPKILDLMRIVLGAFLLAKGLIFLNNSGYLRYLILESGAIKGSPEMISAILYYVTYMHVLGGGLIIVGLFTRLWAVLQLPIVFGAVFFVNITAPYINSELWLSILVLALLIVFAIFGSGPLSLDRLLMNSRNND